MRERLAAAVRSVWLLLPGRVRGAGWRLRIGVWGFRHGAGQEQQWARRVMNADAARAFADLRPRQLDVVEVSGSALWANLPWRSRTLLDFPEFDLCDPPADLGQYDLVICEQVLEHVEDPISAVRTLRRLCKPDGHVFVSTPFLVRIHDAPGDYWRFTPDGLANLLRSQGLPPVWVRSWGNRHVVRANFDKWAMALPWSALGNEPHLPVVVWALARPAA